VREVCTFGAGPVGIKIWQGSLVAYLLESLRGLVIDLENAARPPPTAASVPFGHCVISAAAPWRVVARVKGDGALEEYWRRQLGGIAGMLDVLVGVEDQVHESIKARV
jgi:hypothetical protein